MSSASSSGTSLARTHSSGSSRLPGRPRSPPSMYVAYETGPIKTPKPLLKLEKKTKNKSTKTQPESYPYPNPFPPNPLFEPASVLLAKQKAVQRRPAVPSFLSLRRRPTTGSSALPPPSEDVPAHIAVAPTPLYCPPSGSADLHQTNIHPFDNLESRPRRSNKATRLLGKTLPELQTDPDLSSDFSAAFNTSPRWSSPSDETSSLGDGASAYSFDDGCYADGSHLQRESSLLSAMEFRPPSVIVFAPLKAKDAPVAEAEADVWASEDEAVTPVGPLHARGTWSESPRTRPRGVSNASVQDHNITPGAPPTPPMDFRPVSYASVHDHYIHPDAPPTPPMEHRPDTPFMDTVVAVNSHVVARGHTREQSILRTEPKEGWMGEWNQEDMQEVIQKLRSLK